MAPTPALPPVRRPSVWGKMFGSFRMSNNTNNQKRDEDEDEYLDELSEKMSASMTTGIENAARPTLQQRHSSLAIKTQAPRRVSKPASIKSTKSTASTWSRRSSSRKFSFFQSSNPDDDEDVPPVPALDRSYSDEDLKSPLMPKSPSYVPRSAASSFLRTTTPLNKDEKTEIVHSTHVPELREKAAHLKPIIITPVELRRNPQDGLERHGMYSMAGVCDIEEDGSEEDVPFSPMSTASSCVSPTTVVFSHKRADTFLSPSTPRFNRPFAHRIDSAKASPELVATKNIHTVAIAELEG